MNEDARGLVPLEKLDDLEVADGYTDIRGFEAYLPDGRKIGEVDELLVDTAARRVAAITLDLDDDGLDIGREPHPRVAIEHVEIDTPSRRVLITSAGVGALGVTGGTAAAGTARAGLFEDTTRRDTGAGEQRMTLAEEELDVRRERMAAGAVDVHEHVETGHVRESVPVMRDEVTVERRPLSGTDALHAEGAFQEEHISVPLTREEAVAEKRTVGAEEIVVRKHQVQDHEMVEADLRRERAEVTESGEVRHVDGMRADEAVRSDEGLDLEHPFRGGRDLDGDGVR